jgi:hypothetical protein
MRPVILHPISDKDIFYVPKGTPCGKNTTEKDGYFISELYMKEILNVQTEK